MDKFCSNCGTELKKDASFCSKCGSKIGASNNVYTGEVVNDNTGNSTTSVPKSKIAAGLLGIFLGCFGVHNFYLGYTGKAVAQLLITVLSCGILSFVSYVWGLIEGILILTGSINIDAEGNSLVD